MTPAKPKPARAASRAKPPLYRRPLLSPEQGLDLAGLFRVLASDTRLRLLHALVREDELCVGDLAEALGMRPQAVSNQLRRLVDQGILGWHRNGTNIYYRVVDPCVPTLLDQGLCLAEDAKARSK